MLAMMVISLQLNLLSKCHPKDVEGVSQKGDLPALWRLHFRHQKAGNMQLGDDVEKCECGPTSSCSMGGRESLLAEQCFSG